MALMEPALILSALRKLLPDASEECTSDGGDYEHHDCWAGSPGEPCTCSQGEARETGATHHDGQHNYYEYTCCTVGSGRSGRGEECGDCACRAGVHARARARARAHLPSL